MADRKRHRCLSMYPSCQWVEPFRPDPGVLHPHDIAHTLANSTRYNGACRWFYSVAQHSVNVSRLCSDPRWGLMHDVCETVLGDLVSPIKRHSCMDGYKRAEAGWDRAVARRFGLGRKPADLKATDVLLLAAEMKVLKPECGRSHDERDLLDGRGIETVPADWLLSWSPDRAKAEFLGRFVEVFSTW